MLYNVKWTKKPYFNHNNLRSVDTNYEDEEISFLLQVNENKEYTYRFKAYEIDKMEFCIGYTRGGDKSVFIMVHHNKKERNHILAFYLPRNFEKELIEEIHKFANKYKITFLEHRRINPFLLILIGIIVVLLITYISNKQL